MWLSVAAWCWLVGECLVIAPSAAPAVWLVWWGPAILAFALSKADDERIEAGYATLFALAIIVKIVMVQVLVAL